VSAGPTAQAGGVAVAPHLLLDVGPHVHEAVATVAVAVVGGGAGGRHAAATARPTAAPLHQVAGEAAREAIAGDPVHGC
jgi:hypothetical protein